MNTHDHHDDALPGEDELKRLYRSLPPKEPSPALDQAVRQAATRAAHPARRPPRWAAALASAAALVLAAGIGWRLHERPAGEVPAPIASERNAPAAIAGDDADATTIGATAPAAPRVAAAPPRETIRSALKPRVLASAPVVPAPAPVREAPDRAAVEVSTAAAYAPAALAQAARTAESGRPSTAMQRAIAPPPASDPTAADPTDRPDQELAKIRQLVAAQRHDEALQRLSAFRQAHPDVALPDDLKDLQAAHE